VAKEGAQAKLDAEAIEDQTEREASLKSCADSEKMYKSFFNEEDHNNLLRKSQRSLSHRASKGALMIFLLRSADGVIMFACLRVCGSACLRVCVCCSSLLIAAFAASTALKRSSRARQSTQSAHHVC